MVSPATGVGAVGAGAAGAVLAQADASATSTSAIVASAVTPRNLSRIRGTCHGSVVYRGRMEQPGRSVSLLFDLFVVKQRVHRVLAAGLADVQLRADEYAVYSLLFEQR